MIGTSLGAYHVDSELGAGGMGTVYLATAMEPVGELAAGDRVAVKIVHPQLLGTPDYVMRFLREAELGMRVRHPNVVRTIDVDSVPTGNADGDGGGDQSDEIVSFLVMEYVEGQSLRALLSEVGRAPERLCRHVGHEVARALDAVHGAGIIHRDVKPENVLLTAEQSVKLMDLGIARPAGEATRISQSGAFVGSVHYAAPEQFEGKGTRPDGRSDLYQLGVLLYELACGELPYDGENLRAIMRCIRSETPPRLGDRVPQLSALFEEVVHTLLSKRREDRFASAAVVAQVLSDGEEAPWWLERQRAIRAATRRPPRRARVPRESALYGRDAELARLQVSYARARGGEGRVMLIEGEAGVGKTRLVDELIVRLRRTGEDLNFLFGGYTIEKATAASGAFSVAFREHFGEVELVDALESYLPQGSGIAPAFAALLRGAPAPDGQGHLTQESLQTAFAHVTLALAAERPTVVLIEDLHAAAVESRALFASLALAVRGHRLLLIGTTRPTLPVEWIADLERFQHTQRLVLPRLSAEDVELMLEDVFGSRRLAAELAPRMARKSDGNPFFVLELLKALRDGQIITKDRNGEWTSQPIYDNFEIPSSVRELIAARVSDLDEESRRLLDIASCSGVTFDPVLVAAAAGSPRVSVLRRLARIEHTHRLVRAMGPEFVFDQHQVRDALHESLSDETRSAMHAALANAIRDREREAGRSRQEAPGAVAFDLCRHALRARDPETVRACLAPALDNLEEGFQSEAAVALAGRALNRRDLIVGAQRIDSLLRMARLLRGLGRSLRERDALQDARDYADELGDLTQRARTRVALSRHLQGLGRIQEAMELLPDALEFVREAGDAALEGSVCAATGVALIHLGKIDKASSHLDRALEVARARSDAVLEVDAVLGRGLAALRLGRVDDALVEYERARELARGSGNPRSEATATGQLGRALAASGRVEAAQARFEEQLAKAEEIGYRGAEASAHGSLGVLAARRGEVRGALEHQRQRLDVSREVGDLRGIATALVDLGLLVLSLGDLEAARARFDEALGLCRETGARHPEASGLLGLARTEEFAGEPRRAILLCEGALALRRRIGDVLGTARVELAIGRLRVSRGQESAAARSLQRVLDAPAGEELVGPRLLAALILARAGVGTWDPAALAAQFEAAGDRLTYAERMEAALLLHELGGAPRQLDAANAMLQALIADAPQERAEAIAARVPLHVRIAQCVAAPQDPPSSPPHRA